MAARGRPRGFDRATALERAMQAFWTHGYETTSMTELTSAMEISSPSLYAAFGSKEQLFREAVALYNDTEGGPVTRALTEEPTAYAAVAAVLRENARAYTGDDRPAGCMIVLAAMNVSDAGADVRDHLAQWRRSGVEMMAARLDRGVREGELPPDADTATIAAFYTAVLQGMSVQAVDGARAEDLERVAECALAAWGAVTASHRTQGEPPPAALPRTPEPAGG
ncbi:TetR/AcrR family transcriptional regulator [Streptomyces albipurpureus]|uniref:TetR/AcrR family transcriptional regulator n=1 Tax=Streptomyces albipurpureus TaxID=2897419 RepID=A0ABT0UJR9_9ACTN|nr:TetR/AcrR family transcriptional regulator [Streptomyces sp. CWNU-1]MCM2388502.1 TetR/AcrR family transcriptional regulator [Streptomyces sp. CWNU-1]